MFGRHALCVTVAFAYAAASRKSLTIVSLIDNEPMTKNGRFGSEESDQVEEFKAEIVTPKIKIWNSEDMVLHVINKALRWEANSDRESALWTYVPVSNEGGMLSGKGGLCLFRDEDLVSLRECPDNPSSLVSEYMFKLDIETNPNDLKRCERVIVENQEEKGRKKETSDVRSHGNGGSGIKNRSSTQPIEKNNLDPKRGARENADRGSTSDVGGGKRGPRYPKDDSRRNYDDKDSSNEYPRQRDRDMQDEPPSTYRYSERDSRNGEYVGKPRVSERRFPEDIGRGDSADPERDSRYFDKDFQREHSSQGNFMKGGQDGAYRGDAKNRMVPKEQNRDYGRQGTGVSCRDDPFSCGLLPENGRKPPQGNTLDENALSTLIQLIKKFQQERLSNGSNTQHA